MAWSAEQTALLAQLRDSGVSRADIISRLRSEIEAEELSAALGNGSGAALVVLHGGAGLKAEHNGKRARLLQQGLAGGWANVVVGAKRIKWRSNAWQREGKAAAELPSSAWLRALSFLGGGSLLEAARLHTCAASVSRRFRALPLPQVLGRLDADFFGVADEQALPAALWLGTHGLRLRRLRVLLKRADTGLIVWLLRRCDTEHTMEVNAKTEVLGVKTSCLNDGGRGSRLVEPAFLAATGSLDTVDLTAGDYECDTSVVNMLAQLGVLDTLGLADVAELDKSRADLNDAIAAECPRLVRLKVNFVFRNELARGTGQPFSTSLRELELRMPTHFSETNSADGLIASIPNLEVLHLAGGGHHVAWRIHSPTLRVLDIHESNKGFGVRECVCPLLERFVCCNDFYGNGIRPFTAANEKIHRVGRSVAQSAAEVGTLQPMSSLREARYEPPMIGPTLLDTRMPLRVAIGTAQFGFGMLRSQNQLERVRLEVPGSCMLEFSD